MEETVMANNSSTSRIQRQTFKNEDPIVDDENQFLAGVGIVYSWGSKKLQRKLRKEEEM